MGVAGEQVLAQQFVLLGHCVLRSDIEHPDVIDGLDRISGADCFDEVVAGIKKDDRYARSHLGGQIHQHRISHVGSNYVVARCPPAMSAHAAAGAADVAEGFVGPAQHVGGGGAVEFGSSARGQLT
ncbi:Uncharacterised protein [Mycobacterium tuberculosis]|uniref:Uncharacterized protein n=1 Tax=Mycobacterium tuberculosis TaxID=1773 RepID=A0A0T9BV24_MYCTX|nr:Uncharacterised protein [Mycobacterium tuberculosis]CKR18957.1 Uncharacterised protein [Mycobacterium tuberculosis]CKS05013.1 Uncharacterised protein [Mycobacterium tuberculosis]CKS17113.1 Uncharacterised protein [Mycobacterium tuberculosis]CKS27395.1 Uncharacterised protein [Mycobacterium tuberculosis]